MTLEDEPTLNDKDMTLDAELFIYIFWNDSRLMMPTECRPQQEMAVENCRHHGIHIPFQRMVESIWIPPLQVKVDKFNSSESKVDKVVADYEP